MKVSLVTNIFIARYIFYMVITKKKTGFVVSNSNFLLTAVKSHPTFIDKQKEGASDCTDPSLSQLDPAALQVRHRIMTLDRRYSIGFLSWSSCFAV